ncbi:MAG TPA: ChaN family lipoprotein [Desulfuromonadales bacterium]|nr:ChaN family lipoprotein [Desulfuromonadales bacterium]
MVKTVKYLLLLCCIAVPVCAAAGGSIVRMSDRQVVSFAQMMADVQSSDVTMVAETHDNKKHHELQLEIIRSFQAQKVSVAIGLEMFQTDYQKQLDDWIEGRIPEQVFKDVYARNWSYDWFLYRELFLFARDNHIPMIALNVPKTIVFKVAKKGFESLTPEERRNLPLGVTCDINKPQTGFLKKTFEGVFGHEAKGQQFSYFCEAQAVRNSGMAMIIANNHKRYPDRKLVALAGTWHAVKHGIPERFPNSINLSFRVLLPEIAELGVKNTTSDIADYLIER